MTIDKNTKELFEYVRAADAKNIPSLKSILSSYNIPKISIDELLSNLKKNNENILLIDARTEKEYEESALPFSINFPVLKNHERHDVGLIYKKYSQTSALWLAMQYADPKTESLNKFLKDNNAADKNIILYCWRGGGRSAYLSKMICDLGYNPTTVTSGHKAYRKIVNDFFSQKVFPYELIELSGLTGSGKTELLKSVSDELPVIDLEDAARHYSSLLGQIPYQIKNISPVKNQTAFENNLYSQIYFNSKHSTTNPASITHHTNLTNPTNPTYLIESESKKVGNFEIPKVLYDKMQTSPTIKIISSLECRVERIVKDYFGDDLIGIELMKNKLLEKEKFFKQQLSGKVFDELIFLLDSKRVREFTEIMIKEYYDKKYKDKGKKPVAEISSDDMNSAKAELSAIYSNSK